MNSDLIIQALGLIVLPVLGLIIGKILAIQKDLNDHKLRVSELYVKKDEFNNVMTKIEATLEKIFDRINSLAERRNQQSDENNGS